MASKETVEKYRGPAVIVGITLEGVEDWQKWEREKLSKNEQTNAFKIVYTCAENDANGANHDVKIEISHRELSGKMLEYYTREDGELPTQMDVAIRSLIGQGLLKKGATEADIYDAAEESLIGHAVYIHAWDDIANNGRPYPNARFVSKYSRITGNAMRDRIAAFLSGKPAPVVTPQAAPQATVAAIPLPDAADDIPF